MSAGLAVTLLLCRIISAQVGSEEQATRAAVSAEKAAQAAQRAAEAAEMAAKAALQIAERGTPPVLEQAEPKKEEAPKAQWTGNVALGLVSMTGNTQSLTTNLTSAASRTTAGWILSAKAVGTYGQSTAPSTGESEVLALNGSFQFRGDRRFTPMISGFLLAGVDTDHVNSIEARPYGEAGTGILWINQVEGKLVKLRLHTDLAFRYGYEYRFQYYPTPLPLGAEQIVAPRFGLGFRYALNKDVIFTEEVEVMPTISGPSRVLANSTTKLSARLVAALYLTAGFAVRHDSRPAPEKLQTDTALTMGVEAAF